MGKMTYEAILDHQVIRLARMGSRRPVTTATMAWHYRINRLLQRCVRERAALYAGRPLSHPLTTHKMYRHA